MTLGQITTNCAGEDGEYVSGWDWEGDALITWGVVNGKGKETGNYKYLPKWATEIEDGDYEGRTPGWYSFDDDGCEECLNDVKLPFGNGAVIKSGVSDAQLLFNGEVKNGITDIPVDLYTISGNTTPVAITLGDVTTNCAGEDGEYVSGWDWEGDYLITWGVVNGKGKETGMYRYLPKWATEIEDGDYEGRTPGWYASDDDGCEECLNGVKLEAGDGFIIKSGAEDSAIQINKNPLAK